MEIDLRNLKKKGKTEEDFFFLYSPEKILSDIPNTEIITPVKVLGKVYLLKDRKAYVEGEVNFTVKGECTRCLEQTAKDFVAVFNENVEPNNQEGYSTYNDVILLSKIVDDAIVLNLPVSFVCADECKGLCPNCGANLNNGECNCKN